MTKAEWLEAHDITYISHVKFDEEADEEWIRSMELLLKECAERKEE